MSRTLMALNNLPKDVYVLLKRLAGVKGLTLSEIILQAIDIYLETEQVKQEIEFYRLDREIDSGV